MVVVINPRIAIFVGYFRNVNGCLDRLNLAEEESPFTVGALPVVQQSPCGAGELPPVLYQVALGAGRP